MKRITVEMVKDAYAKTGLKPTQEVYYSRDKTCACAIGAMYTKETGCSSISEADERAVELFGEDYIFAFVDGFDGQTKCRKTDTYLQGYEDGRAAWEAVKDCSHD